MTVTQLSVAHEAEPRRPLNDYATALANINALVDDLTDARAVIVQLRNDLHHEQDRCIMLVEDRDHWRKVAKQARDEWATLKAVMDAIREMASSGQESARIIRESDERPSQPETSPEAA
jgi:uncharacterized coiled-coil DUF342 family protein